MRERQNQNNKGKNALSIINPEPVEIDYGGNVVADKEYGDEQYMQDEEVAQQQEDDNAEFEQQNR